MTSIEFYKGIEFVRISSFTEAEKNVFWQTFDRNKIIKILMNDSLLNDCIQYQDYREWMAKDFHQEVSIQQSKEETPMPILKFA